MKKFTRVYKYKLETVSTSLEIPRDHKILHVDEQNSEIFLWAEVVPDSEMTTVTIQVFGTGWDMPGENRRFINTFFMRNKSLVFHAFELLES
jgi:hypothetical protein